MRERTRTYRPKRLQIDHEKEEKFEEDTQPPTGIKNSCFLLAACSFFLFFSSILSWLAGYFFPFPLVVSRPPPSPPPSLV